MTAPRSQTDEAMPHATIEENVGAGLGIAAGVAVGAIGGPIGMIVGASIGSVVGEAAGSALHERHVAAAEHAPARRAPFLSADHEALETMAESVPKAIAEGDPEDVAAIISTLQSRVLAHLEGEERDLLPGYAEVAPEDARALLREHAEIRRLLAQLDLGVDLHLVRADAVEALLVGLRAHAARENGGLYRWATSSTDEPPRSSRASTPG